MDNIQQKEFNRLSEMQQTFFKEFTKTFGQQVEYNKQGIDNEIKKTLTKMLSEYDSLNTMDFPLYHQKISQLMVARMMFP